MGNSKLHNDLIVVDGLNVSNWSREVFEDMQRGGITVANCTCCVWENFLQTIANITQWLRWFDEHGDILMQIKSTADVQRAKDSQKTGVILGFQNVSAFEDRLDTIRLYKALGIGIVQLAYNTQNLVGTGCYESKDGGLSDFGCEVVAEMNRVGIMCDLSHVGPVTSTDAIRLSKAPVCYSHCLPAGLKQHPRNKSDEQLKFIADHGGFIGVTMFSPFLAKGPNATVDDYVAAIDYVVDRAGEDCVGIGTDFTQGHDPTFFEWITHDKGTARKLTEFGEIKNPKGIRTIGEMPNLTTAMQRAGWPEVKIRKIMGENWIRVLNDVWDV